MALVLGSNDFAILDMRETAVDIVKVTAYDDGGGSPENVPSILFAGEPCKVRERTGKETDDTRQREIVPTFLFYFTRQLHDVTTECRVTESGVVYRVVEISGRELVGRVFTLKCVKLEGQEV